MLTFDGCEPGANPWVEKYFHDCVMDDRDAVGFALGLCSIFVWLTAQLPQFISNMKNQSSEALSIWFLVEWFAGDTLNLLGCLIQGQQLPTTTILAAYFVLMDVIMLLQYIYYGALQARRKRLRAKGSRRRQSHRHASTAHYHSRDDSQQQALRLLPDGGATPESNELSSGLEGSALPTPEGGYLQSAATAGGPRSNSNLRTLTAATAAGVSMVCVAALALHPGASSASAGRHLLSSPNNQRAATALVAGIAADSLGSSGTASRSSTGSAAILELAAGGPALSFAGRRLAAALYPAASLSPGSRGNDDDDSGDGYGSGSSGCSFLNCDVALVAGTAMGYLSTCFYLASRVSQIRKNLARKSTEGLSPVMFMLTMSANMCTGISIVLRLRSVEQLKEQLPWMCGTFGTIALDMTLFYQALTFTPGQHHHEGAGSHDHSQHHQHSHHCHDGLGHEHGRAPSGRQGNAPSGRGGNAASDRGVGKLADLEAPLLGPIVDVEGLANGGGAGVQG